MNLREFCGITDTMGWITERRWIWNKHIPRTEQNKLVKTARENKLSSNRKIRMPKKRWCESLYNINGIKTVGILF